MPEKCIWRGFAADEFKMGLRGTGEPFLFLRKVGISMDFGRGIAPLVQRYRNIVDLFRKLGKFSTNTGVLLLETIGFPGKWGMISE